MENIKIEKKDVAIGILDIIDGMAFGALVGKAVACFMPTSTKVAINLVLSLAYVALSGKLASIGWAAMHDYAHDINEDIVNSVSDLIDAFKAARA